MARLESYRLRKSFQPRPFLLTAIYSLTFCPKLLENSSYFERLSAGMEDGEGRLRKGIRETTKYRIRMLGQAGRLSERQRVKPWLSLSLIRIRYFVVSLIPWSEARSHPPSPQNTFQKSPLFSDVFHEGVSELYSCSNIKRGCIICRKDVLLCK